MGCLYNFLHYEEIYPLLGFAANLRIIMETPKKRREKFGGHRIYLAVFVLSCLINRQKIKTGVGGSAIIAYLCGLK
jgi:hypothetical protein